MLFIDHMFARVFVYLFFTALSTIMLFIDQTPTIVVK